MLEIINFTIWIVSLIISVLVAKKYHKKVVLWVILSICFSWISLMVLLIMVAVSKKKTLIIDGCTITFKKTPPNFRAFKSAREGTIGETVDELSTCGFCGYYGNARCRKYGVEYDGVGCAVKTVCDDYYGTPNLFKND